MNMMLKINLMRRLLVHVYGQAIGDHVVLGGTYVKDNQETTTDYELRGTDVTVHLGKDATITGRICRIRFASAGDICFNGRWFEFYRIGYG